MRIIGQNILGKEQSQREGLGQKQSEAQAKGRGPCDCEGYAVRGRGGGCKKGDQGSNRSIPVTAVTGTLR